MLGVLIEGGSREGTLAPNDACNGRWELRDVCVSNHAADIVAHDVNGLGDADVLGDQFIEILREDVLGVAVWRVGGVPGATIVGDYDSVAGLGEGAGDVAELVG